MRQRLGSRVRVLESAGVGDDARVEAGRDVLVDLHLQILKESRDELGRRRRGRDHDVECAEVIVPGMMVDVDQNARFGAPGLQVAETVRCAAVDREERVDLWDVVGLHECVGARAGTNTRTGSLLVTIPTSGMSSSRAG